MPATIRWHSTLACYRALFLSLSYSTSHFRQPFSSLSFYMILCYLTYAPSFTCGVRTFLVNSKGLFILCRQIVSKFTILSSRFPTLSLFPFFMAYFPFPSSLLDFRLQMLKIKPILSPKNLFLLSLLYIRNIIN